MSSSEVEPSVTRRLLPPRSYCTTQLREPPSRRRSPKPPSSSSQKVLSFVPGCSTSALAAVVVSFTRCPPAGQVMGTFALRPPAISRYRPIRAMASCVSSLQALACSCTLLQHPYSNCSESRWGDASGPTKPIVRHKTRQELTARRDCDPADVRSGSEAEKLKTSTLGPLSALTQQAVSNPRRPVPNERRRRRPPHGRRTGTTGEWPPAARR